MVRSRVLRVLAPAALTLLAVLAVPANAAIPEGWSATFDDVTGATVECFDFKRCNQAQCPAIAFAAGMSCRYENVTEDFAPGRTRTTVTCPPGFPATQFAVPVQKFTMDVTCARLGTGFWTFFGLDFGPASCGAVAEMRGFGGPGGPTFTESYSGSVFAPRGTTCAGFFGSSPSAPLKHKSIVD